MNTVGRELTQARSRLYKNWVTGAVTGQGDGSECSQGKGLRGSDYLKATQLEN